MLVTYFVNFRQLNDPLIGKELFIRFSASAFRKLPSFYVFSYFPFGSEGRIWDLIVSIPDHCLSFYFTYVLCSYVEPRDNLKLFAQILRIPVYLSYQFCTFYVLDVILWGQKQIIKIYVTDVTSHHWFIFPTTLHNGHNLCIQSSQT